MMFSVLVVLIALVGHVLLAQGVSLPQATPLERATEMLSKMTLSEKIAMMAGVHAHYTGNIPGNERLGIPKLSMQDGPQGFRANEQSGGAGSTTSWPSALTIASSWDTELLRRWGAAMAEEFRGKGADMALAPGIGIARVPTAGRNFEYLCGEDPFLGAILVKEVVHGLQDNGVIANAKHFVNNEIEDHRMLVSAEVNERVRFELYYPPFAAAAEAGVHSVMCAYNRINDVYACQNNNTLSHLRNDLKFDGWVVSDWTATKSTVQSLQAGMDVEMPYSLFYNQHTFDKHLAAGEITESQIDDAVLRVLKSMYAIGMFDRPASGDITANVTSEAHNQLAREVAAKATVLLKNDGNILPLRAESLGDCIAVFGDEDTITGGGSGAVSPPYIITPKMGISLALGNAKTEVIYNDGSDLQSVTDLAQKCSFAVVVVATTSSEGHDRESLSLSDQYNSLVTTVAQVNSKTIVDVRAPGAVLMPWSAQVPAILISGFGGQEAGNGLADVLFGVVNPYGRLPVTMPNKENEVSFSKAQYPGVGVPPKAHYTEELLIGYRWYDAHDVEPLFPFGHGLSYTTFEYDKLEVIPSKLPADLTAETVVANVMLTIRNSGPVDGVEIAQLYVEYPKAALEPHHQLRNFAKVELGAGKEHTVHFALTMRDCAIWDTDSHDWKLLPGKFTVLAGSSSRKLPLSAELPVLP